MNGALIQHNLWPILFQSMLVLIQLTQNLGQFVTAVVSIGTDQTLFGSTIGLEILYIP